jgi:hypothetical protein
MNKRFSWPQLILLVLIIVFIVIGLVANFSRFLIPIVVLGSIFILYKFPPNRWKFNRKKQYSVHNRKKSTRKSKAKLHVIQGSKTDDTEDDKPRYH